MKKIGLTLNECAKSMMISCKKATFLICKKEETKLSFFENAELKLHLYLCRFCRLFEIQSTFICRNASNADEHSDNLHLSDSAKEKISVALNDVFE